MSPTATPTAGAFDLVVRLGRALHAAGAPAHRLEETLERVAAHLGVAGQFFATPTALFASSSGEGEERTVLVRIEPGDNDLGRRVEIEEAAADLLAGRLTAEEAARRVEAIVGPAPAVAPLPLPAWTELPAFGLAACGLLVLFRARPRDVGWIAAGAALALYGSRLGARVLGPDFAAFAGAFLLGVGANLSRRLANRPTALMQVPGLVLLVPGSLGFKSVAALLSEDVLAGVQAAFTAALVAVSLVTGLLIANVLVAPRAALRGQPLGQGSSRGTRRRYSA